MTLFVAGWLRYWTEGRRADATEMKRGHDRLAEQVAAFNVHDLRLAGSELNRRPDAERVAVDRDQHGLLETGEPFAKLGARDGIHVPDGTRGYNA